MLAPGVSFLKNLNLYLAHMHMCAKKKFRVDTPSYTYLEKRLCKGKVYLAKQRAKTENQQFDYNFSPIFNNYSRENGAIRNNDN